MWRFHYDFGLSTGEGKWKTYFLTCFDQQLVPADVKQRRIKNPVKRLRWSFYVQVVNGFRYSTESVRIRKYSTFLSNPISDKDFKNLNFQILFGEYYFKIDFQVSSILKKLRKTSQKKKMSEKRVCWNPCLYVCGTTT